MKWTDLFVGDAGDESTETVKMDNQKWRAGNAGSAMVR